MEASDPGVAAVCDAGPLIHLDELGCLDLLCGFSSVLIAPAVWNEVEKHRPESLARLPAGVEKASPPRPLPTNLRTLVEVLGLHSGEAQSLQLAIEQKAKMFLTDDSAARLAGKSLGMACHGTIGLVIRAIRLGRRSKANVIDLLRNLPARSSLHIRPSLLEQIVVQVSRDA